MARVNLQEWFQGYVLSLIFGEPNTNKNFTGVEF